MKKAVFFILLLVVGVNLFGQQKTQVLVLASYHMGNPGMDEFNMNADDVTTPKRQKEIEEFVKILSDFKPTVICLEYPYERQAKLHEAYQNYLDGKYELKKNERDQVGFRLAKKQGLKTVYAIDADAPFEMDTVMKAAQAFNAKGFLDKISQMPGVMASENKKLHESTIKDFYLHLNKKENINDAHAVYLEMAKVGKGNNYAGADLVADWYQRNLRIYANLFRLNLKPEDRVIILYGSGHAKIFQDLVEDSADLKLVELKDLMK